MSERPAWLPTVCNEPLSEDYPTDGHRLLDLVDRYWTTPDGEPVHLDDWQRDLICRILERYPDDYKDPELAGRLRYRQVVISMARQNGKSLLAAILSLYGLVQHCAGPLVIGVASSREQAEVVYSRTHYVVRSTPALSKRIKPTGTRGLKYRNGAGSYEMRASKGDALQGLPITLGLADELHLMRPEVWDSIVNGQRAQKDGLIIGITTAGDDDSILLRRLYKQGMTAVENPDSRFGFFLWEAPEGSTIDTPGALEAASPAIACGRIPASRVREDVRELPEVDQQRFTLNRWVSAVNGWIPPGAWRACARSDGGIPTDARDVVFAVDKTPEWTYATITAAFKDPDGILHTEVVESMTSPTHERLVSSCVRLSELAGHATFVVDGYSLRNLARDLKGRGLEVWSLSGAEVCTACSTSYALIVQRRVSHCDDELLRLQMPRGRRKNVGEHWRISRPDSGGEIDSLMATVMGLYVAEVKEPAVMQLF